MVVNNSMFAPKSMAVAFQPAQQIMKMVSTINNNLAIRQDSFAKSAELEKQMRMMLLTEGGQESKVENPAVPQGFNLILQSPEEAQSKVIDSITQTVSSVKDYAAVVAKHEAILADESSTDEQRVLSSELVQNMKKQMETTLNLTIDSHNSFWGGFGRRSDKKSSTDQYAKLVELTGDLSAKGLGLTGFASMNSEEILEKLDGALAHLNEMGKLVNPSYMSPKITPETQKSLDRFELISGGWKSFSKTFGDVIKEPMEKTTLNIYA